MNKLTKNQANSIQVLALIANGMTPVEALKKVCGTDTVDTMISDLYNKLRNAAESK